MSTWRTALVCLWEWPSLLKPRGTDDIYFLSEPFSFGLEFVVALLFLPHYLLLSYLHSFFKVAVSLGACVTAVGLGRAPTVAMATPARLCRPCAVGREPRLCSWKGDVCVNIAALGAQLSRFILPNANYVKKRTKRLKSKRSMTMSVLVVGFGIQLFSSLYFFCCQIFHSLLTFTLIL